MPRFSRPVVVGDQVIGIECGREPDRACSTPGCRNHADKSCGFAVVRKGHPGTCDRAVCESCAVKIGGGLRYCGAHGRAHAGQFNG